MFSRLLLGVVILSTFSYANEGKQLYIKYNCNGCHSPYEKRTGPSFKEISQRYGTSQKAIEKVAKLIIKPNPSNWPGFAYMPPYNIPFEEAKKLAEYVLIGSQKEKETKPKIRYIPEGDHY